MSSRRVKIVLLCEDSQQEAFTRRFLAGMGWNTRELRVEKSPSAKGSAEQWVREKFPSEIKVYRQRRLRAASGLIVMIDADEREVQDRINDFEAECNAKQVQFRGDDDAVAIAVPKRNIETWIHYLADNPVNEKDTYRKLEKERLCKPAVQKLLKMCKTTGLSEDAPESLSAACHEFNLRIATLLA
ncbi:MAG: hypothetical protein COZ12_01940 [Deltaproteobacteria bacterium CG_4_10_14_3_um_filter_60_8]|nr:MAG: hypothetical protein AUK28_05530 [Desulfobacterales bacterium CG2_30_60_27]PIP43430.1 MAG: hypothetical protein COX17_07060 [Deltaproteobacteria bacterium CG23_combo_of_CG06-09_8_20_14_all_60_8]PIY23558.1 MAG: hypothetical protein COZ12_01940 [Deltaproteobacteria bacterium CG_4_10_14_3_um_filter_60_8]